MDEDDGCKQWQSVIHQNIPAELGDHIEGVSVRGWRISDLDMAPNSRWYLRGEPLFSEENSTAKHYSWWSENLPNETLQKLVRRVKSKGLKVFFGSDDRCLLLNTEKGNSYHDASSNRKRVNPELVKRIRERHEDGGEIFLIRLFSFDQHNTINSNTNDESGTKIVTKSAYFMYDNEGCQWSFSGYSDLKDHVKSCKDIICDVTIAGDGNWIVIHPTRFVASKGIPERLQRRLRKFYAEQRRRREQRKADINYYCREDDCQEESSKPENSSDNDISDLEENLKEESNDSECDHSTYSIGDLLEEECKRLKNDTDSIPQQDGSSEPSEEFPFRSTVSMLNNDGVNHTSEIPQTNPNESSFLYNNGHLGSLVGNFATSISTQPIISSENELELLTAELEKITTNERLKRIEQSANADSCFLWRGLRASESGRGIFAGDPTSESNIEDAVVYNSHQSQYIHLTANPRIATYYAAAFCEDVSSRCRIAQIDVSKIPKRHIFDLSTRDKCKSMTNERARNIASENELVLVYEYIPVSAIVSLIDLPQTIPRGVRGTLYMYLEELNFNSVIENLIYTWIHSGVKILLHKELSSMKRSELKHPPHVITLAKHLGNLSTGQSIDENIQNSPFQNLWRKIVFETESGDAGIQDK